MKRKRFWIFLILIGVGILCWLISWIPVTEQISLDLLATEDKNVRIALITDLHSCWYGSGQKDLLARVEKEQPDIVLLGGDIFDDVRKDDLSKVAVAALAEKYPSYYVSGNHEWWSGRMDEMKAWLESAGVCVLAGDCETITCNGCIIDICGIDDPTDIGISRWREQMERAYGQTDESHLRLLLTHRPEMVEEYAKYDYDLIMAGHAHGGQFWIPLLRKGVFAPDQGLMATYVNGLYELPNGSILEVSRGLARERVPAPRFFNPPEVVVIDIH